MTVCALDPPSHTVVLNKFAIVPEHAILITRAFRPQTHLLERADLAAAHACVEAYRRAGEPEDAAGEGSSGADLFVFFNSGPHSGASQPHRHLQLLPVARMRDGLEPARRREWDVLAARVLGEEERQQRGQLLPFAVLAEPVTPDTTPDELHRLYVGLYRRAVRLVRPEVAAGEAEVPLDGEALISYNLALTSSVLALCPRTAEGAPVRGAAGEEAGFVALNGTVLAGTALVKNQAEWDALREQPEQLLAVLGQIGVPPPSTSTNEPTVTGNL